MCGRFASARRRQELLAEFQVERDQVAEPLAPDYNVAPTKQIYAVLDRAAPGGGPGPERDARRELRVVRWGLVPSWAKDMSMGSRLINARAETVDTKPAFRRAFARRRCLIPADGFYEWRQPAGGGRKQPYYIHRSDGGVLAFAGLYELWRDRSLPDDHPRAWLWTAAIITTRAQDDLGWIHDRMPMVIGPDRWADWLNAGRDDPAGARALLEPAAETGLASHPVSTAVNSVRSNGPGLIEPEAEGEGAGSASRPETEEGGAGSGSRPQAPGEPGAARQSRPQAPARPDATAARGPADAGAATGRRKGARRPRADGPAAPVSGALF